MRLARVERLSQEAFGGMGFSRRLDLCSRRVRRRRWRCCRERRVEASAANRETIRKYKEAKKKGEIGEEGGRQRRKGQRPMEKRREYLWNS